MSEISRWLVPVDRVLRSRNVVSAVALLGLFVAGCGARHQVPASGCGPSYTFSINGQSTDFGCSGAVFAPLRPIRLRVGEKFGVISTAPQAFRVPMPSSPALKIIVHRHGSAVYQAVRPGHSFLFASDLFCQSPGHIQNGRVLAGKARNERLHGRARRVLCIVARVAVQ